MKLHSVWLEHWFLRVTGHQRLGCSGAGHLSDTRIDKKTGWLKTVLVSTIIYYTFIAKNAQLHSAKLKWMSGQIFNLQEEAFCFSFKSTDVKNSVSIDMLNTSNIYVLRGFNWNIQLPSFSRVHSNLLWRAISTWRFRMLSLWENQYLGFKFIFRALLDRRFRQAIHSPRYFPSVGSAQTL